MSERSTHAHALAEATEPKDEVTSPRRSKGEGSLRQVRNGYWEAMLDLGYVDGKRLRPTFRGRTKAEAIAKRKEYEAAHSRGEPVANTRLTITQLCEEWLDNKVATKVALGELKQKTEDNYRDMFSTYVKPLLGSKQVRALRTADVDAMSARMRKAGLSQNTVRLARSVLRMALGYAIAEKRIITVNVVNESVRPNVVISADDHTTLSLAQSKVLLRRAPSDVFGILLRVALWTGMREGELVGLLWSDVDFKARRLTVTGTLGRVKGKGLVRTDPKTEASKAPVPLPDPVIQLLRRQLRQQGAQRKEAGEVWQETGYVFTSARGRPIEGRKVLREWRRIQDSLKLPAMTVHELRHTTGTLLLNAGVPLEVVSAILRHANISVTKDIYAKVEEPLARQGMETFQVALTKRRAS